MFPLKTLLALSLASSVLFAAGDSYGDDSQLLDIVQNQTFRYFWDFGHPVSGLARDRSDGNDDICCPGGTGMGIMSIIAAVNRQFITRNEASERITKIVTFLYYNATRYHGAWSHWVNGTSGETLKFGAKDDGGDLVETSYLMQGLLVAREYFNDTNSQIESELRHFITAMWGQVQWDWFTRDGQHVLYWHWSADQGWIMNYPIRGWNEALITYVMAASSPTYPIDPVVYHEGWADNGTMQNGKQFYNTTLPLGPSYGGPLFFEEYTFMTLDPRGLKDMYADYWEQAQAHTRINYEYCVENPKNYTGYGPECWGLTASDDPNGYVAHAPDGPNLPGQQNDTGTISPTAALAAMPYAPVESMAALKHFYYDLGANIWGPYGFVDAFKLDNVQPWYAKSFLAIDQGPIVVMIENYRSGLFWQLFTQCSEINDGLRKLGFTAPYL